MIFRALLFLFFLTFNLYAQEQQNVQESDQQISDFSLAGYGEKGEKSWDLAGQSADIFGNLIKLKDVVGNLYDKKEDIHLTADKGDFDKAEGKVHLEQNVVITTSGGARLTTNALDWDRKNKLVTTKEVVNITKENLFTRGRGVLGQPNLNQVRLEKEVKVVINPQAQEGKVANEKDRTVIICDGPLDVDYAKNIATFKNKVKVDTQGNLIYSDIMDVYFIPAKTGEEPKPSEQSSLFMGTQIEKIIARGNVEIIHGENTSYSEEATYTAFDKKLVLMGKPKLIIYSTEELGASLGN